MRFTETLLQPEIPDHVMSLGSLRVPCQVSLHWSSEEELLVGLLWQEPLGWRTIWLQTPPADSIHTGSFVYWRGGPRCCHGNQRRTKPARMGLPVWLKDLFTHTPVHTCTLHHTHIGMNTHMLTLTGEAYVDRLCQAHKWLHGHIPMNLQSPYCQSAFPPPREPCQSSCRMCASGGRNLG